jgi:hypothetical protein
MELEKVRDGAWKNVALRACSGQPCDGDDSALAGHCVSRVVDPFGKKPPPNGADDAASRPGQRRENTVAVGWKNAQKATKAGEHRN